MSKIAFIFPGQGSQAVGMAADFVLHNEQSKQFIQQADQILQFPLSEYMLEGPQQTLTLTYNAQPALLTSGIIAAKRLQQAGIEASFVAGHSLGEFAALVYAGALSFNQAVSLVHQRGLFMEQAVPAGEGAMTAVLGLDERALKQVCEEITEQGFPVQLANINCQGQIVISGTAIGVERAGILAKEYGAKRAIPLDVSGPFHSSLMAPAAAKLAEQLHRIDWHTPTIPVVSNVTSQLLTKQEELAQELIAQVTSPVYWQQNVEQLIAQGVTIFIECGPGKVLTGLMKKINRDVQAFAVYDEQTLAQTVAALNGVEA